MLRIIQHFDSGKRKCPITENKPAGDFVGANVESYSVGPRLGELHDIFVQVAAAAYSSGRKLDPAELARTTFIVAEAAATAGFSEMFVDFRTEEDRKREREAAGGPVIKNAKPIKYSAPTSLKK